MTFCCSPTASGTGRVASTIGSNGQVRMKGLSSCADEVFVPHDLCPEGLQTFAARTFGSGSCAGGGPCRVSVPLDPAGVAPVTSPLTCRDGDHQGRLVGLVAREHLVAALARRIPEERAHSIEIGLRRVWGRR